MSNKIGFRRDPKEFLAKLGCGDRDRSLNELGVRITSISAAGGEKVTVKVLVSNPSGREETEFTVMDNHAEEMGLEIGAIDEELLPELEYYADVARAYSSACSSFAFAPSSYMSLKNKLVQKGFSRDVCDDAINCLKLRGFVKEDEIALRRAQILVEKHWGRQRILIKLREEGFMNEALDSALTFLDSVDFTLSCAKLIQKKYGAIPSDKSKFDRMYASLARMGYSGSVIRVAVRSLSQE